MIPARPPFPPSLPPPPPSPAPFWGDSRMKETAMLVVPLLGILYAELDLTIIPYKSIA